MPKFKYLRVTSKDMLWGKQTLTKEYLVSVASTGDALIDLENMTYFDPDENKWLEIRGDFQ